MRARHRGATLIDVVATIVIIGVLVLMLLPALMAAGRVAHQTNCQNNQRQLAQGLLNYHSEHDAFPPGLGPIEYSRSAVGDLSWGVRLLPYIEQTMLANALVAAAPLDAPENLTFRVTRVSIFLCPASVPRGGGDDVSLPAFNPALGPAKVARATYVGSFGTGDPLDPAQAARGDGMFFRGRSIRIEDVHDGTSTTFLTGERTPEAGPSCWAGVVGPKGVGTVLGSTAGDPGPNARPLKAIGYGSRHGAGAYFSFGDGSVRWVADDISRAVYAGLATRDGGEILSTEE